MRIPFPLPMAVLALCVAAGAADDPVAVLDRSLARPQRETLPNGTTVLLLEDHSAPVVSIQVWVGTGSIDEQEYLGSGISHAIEHMIFKGTERRPVGAITRELNGAGGKVNAYTTLDRTVFHTDLPSRHWRLGLDVLADAVYRATFPAEEWARERDVILREIAMGDDNPDRVIGRLLWETVYTVHPLRVPVIGYADAFKGLTRDDLATFARRRYVPDNVIVAVVGDIRPDEAGAAVRELFGSAQRRARAPSVLPTEPAQTTPRMARRTGPFNVSRIAWAYPTVPLNHPDAPVLDVLASVTGQGRSSRLTARLRERDALVTDISAFSFSNREQGMFGISAVFDPSREAAVTNAIATEIADWIRSGFTRDEVLKAKRQNLTGAVAALQTMHGMADSIASGMFYAQDTAYSAVYLRRVEAVTPSALRDAASRYLLPERMTLAILSPTRPETTGAVVATPTNRPTCRREALTSQVPLIVRDDHRLPLVHVCVVARGGLLSENETNNGITRLMAELLTRGTERRSAADIAQMVESLGAGLSSFSGNNSFGLSAYSLAADLPVILDLVGECLTRPSFTPDEIERQRTIQLSAIARERERPMFTAQEALNARIFAGHPYRLSPSGTTGSVSRIDRDAITAFAARHLVTGNLVISVFGDVPPGVRELTERAFRRLPAGAYEASASPQEPQLPARIEKTEPRQQAIVLAGFPGVRLGDPAADALSVLATAMSGMSATLWAEVREKRGLAYYVGAYQQPGIHPGSFVLYAGTKPEAVAEVERLFADEIVRIRTQGITTNEFERARNQILADCEMDEQSNSELAMSCALNELYGLGFEHGLQLPRRLRTLTPDAIRDAAASVLTTNRMAVSIVLPAARP